MGNSENYPSRAAMTTRNSDSLPFTSLVDFLFSSFLSLLRQGLGSGALLQPTHSYSLLTSSLFSPHWFCYPANFWSFGDIPIRMTTATDIYLGALYDGFEVGNKIRTSKTEYRRAPICQFCA